MNINRWQCLKRDKTEFRLGFYRSNYLIKTYSEKQTDFFFFSFPAPTSYSYSHSFAGTLSARSSGTQLRVKGSRATAATREHSQLTPLICSAPPLMCLLKGRERQ